MHDLGPALGARIKKLRKRLGISQEELAHRSNLHWTYISDLERGQQSPTIDVVNRLTRGLGVSLAEFFSTLDQLYRVRARKPRQDLPRRMK